MSEVVPFAELDFAATVSSGQVFRFVNRDGKWAGPDGRNVITAEKSRNGWRVSSWPDRYAYRKFLQLDKKWSEVAERIISLEPRLKDLVRRYPGLRLVRCADPVETLFSFLCTPNNHLSRISRMVSYLGAKGNVIKFGAFAFPSIDVLSNISAKELARAGFGYRSRSIVASAARLLELGGSDWLQSVQLLSAREAACELQLLPGVGPKVADCVCLFGLHFDSAVPLDVHLWRAACGLFRPELENQSVTRTRYCEVQEAFVGVFQGDSGWAQQFLFYDRLLKQERTI